MWSWLDVLITAQMSRKVKSQVEMIKKMLEAGRQWLTYLRWPTHCEGSEFTANAIFKTITIISHLKIVMILTLIVTLMWQLEIVSGFQASWTTRSSLVQYKRCVVQAFCLVEMSAGAWKIYLMFIIKKHSCLDFTWLGKWFWACHLILINHQHALSCW